MPNGNQTQEEFLKEFIPDESKSVLEQPLIEPTVEKQEEVKGSEDDENEKFNRRERRLQAKLQAERESSIALAARLEALTEAQKFTRDVVPSSFEEKAMRIYGNETPENAAATQLLIASLKEVQESAKKEALETFREEQRKEREAVKKEESTLDSMVEDLEDKYGVTIDESTQKGFFQLLEKMSPKDRDGNIQMYADHNAVWEEMQSIKATPVVSRAKDLASRSMVRTGASPQTGVEADSNERWLRENGII